MRRLRTYSRRTPARAARSLSSVNYDSYLSSRASRRLPSAIRALQPLVSLPGMISLGGGMPHPSTFPFAKLSLEFKPTVGGEVVEVEGSELIAGLQYSPTPGLPALTSQLLAMQRAEHTPPPAADADLALSVTTGSQDGLSKAFDMLLEEGDTLLIEEPTYSGSLAYLEPLGCTLTAVPTDAEGLVPSELRRMLESWPVTQKRPRVLYTIPTGGNPTGATLSAARRAELYAVACEHDLVVLEDDPYYYLQFEGGNAPPPVRSLLSIDTEARVLRFDSFSKLLSSGLRLGLVTGPAPLVERIDLHTQATTMHSCGIAQVMLLKLFDQWALTHPEGARGGFLAHCASTRDFYQQRRDAFVASAERHLGERATWVEPAGGMFVWIKLHGVVDSQELIMVGALDAKGPLLISFVCSFWLSSLFSSHFFSLHFWIAKVLLVPGAAFLPADAPPTPYVRAAFSTASEADMDEAMRRLALLLPEAEGEGGGAAE